MGIAGLVPVFPTSPRARSKGKGEAHRAVLLDVTCGRSEIADERGVGVVEAGGYVALIAILDHVGICAPGLAVIRAHHEAGGDAELEAGAVLQAKLVDPAAVEWWSVTEIDGGLEQSYI